MLLLVGTCPAEDRVVLAASRAGGASSTLRGEILDYRGSGLRMRLASGREESFDAARVTEITTEWPERLSLGETAWRAGQWDEAIAHYRAAAADEKRGWVKRRLLARLVEVLRDARRIGDAGDAFLALYKADPQTPYFAVIPLDWTQAAPEAAAVETRARQWLKQDAVAPAVLLGASWLMSRSDRGSALAALRRLTDETDPRVAHLAEAQFWRTRAVAAPPDEIERWQGLLERMPADLRPGPTFVVAQALARRGEAPAAALHLLRIPILWSDHRELAAVALWEAGRQLDQAPKAGDAAGLFREIVSLYPASSVAESAKMRLTNPPAADGPSASPSP